MRHEPGTILINFSLSNRPLGVFVKPIEPMQCLFCVVHLQVVYEMKSNLNEADIMYSYIPACIERYELRKPGLGMYKHIQYKYAKTFKYP